MKLYRTAYKKTRIMGVPFNIVVRLIFLLVMIFAVASVVEIEGMVFVYSVPFLLFVVAWYFLKDKDDYYVENMIRYYTITKGRYLR